MPTRKKSTATQAPCNGCACCSRNPEDHTCPIAQKVPPQTVSKQDFFKPIKTARKEKTPTARQIASAPVYKPGVAVKLPRGAKPSTDADFMRIFAPELCGGPPLSGKERKWLAVQIADATWKQHPFTKMGYFEAIKAFKACQIVVNPWAFDWFPGFVNSRAAGKKRQADGQAKGRATRTQEAYERFDENDFEGMSQTHKAHYNRLATKIAYEVADRDRKERPTDDEIWKKPCYSVRKSNFRCPTPIDADSHTGTTGSTSRTARATPTPAPAACGSSAVGTTVRASWSGSSTGTGARTTASCPTPRAATSATRRAARTRTPRRRRSTTRTRRTRGTTPARSGGAASRSWAAARTTRRRGASRLCARQP